MITLGWVRMTALYNAWQNSGLRRDVQALDAGEATRDRGAFFGSILGTCDHLLRADKMWLSRLADGPEAPPGGIAESRNLTPDVAAWAARRKATNTAITRWAEALSDCDGDLTCSSGALGRDITRPMAVLLTHFFNRQTHHRGQIHAMLTAAGVEPEDTDLPFMPEPA